MSSAYLYIVPADAHHIPPPAARRRALRLLERMFPVPPEVEPDELNVVRYPEPHGWEHEATVHDGLEFIDPGENRTAAICPACDARLDLHQDRAEWWLSLEERAEEEGWDGLRVEMPCCRRTVLATDLRFDWPGAFARFELSVLDPAPGEPLAPEQLAQLEAALGCPVRQVWAHY